MYITHLASVVVANLFFSPDLFYKKQLYAAQPHFSLRIRYVDHLIYMLLVDN